LVSSHPGNSAIVLAVALQLNFLPSSIFTHSKEPDNEDDPIVLELVRLMRSDSSKDIRIAVLESISLNKLALEGVVERVCDVQKEVRLAALRRLFETEPRNLPAQARLSVIEHGLADRDASVVQVCRRLVCKWVADLDFNVARMFHLLTLHTARGINNNATELAQAVGWVLLEEAEGSDPDCPVANSAFRQACWSQLPDWHGARGFAGIAPAELLWALIRCERALHKAGSGSAIGASRAEELCSGLIPDVTQLCALLRQAHQGRVSDSSDDADTAADEQLLRESVPQQLSTTLLLRMASIRLSAGGDEAGTAALTQICTEMLRDIYLPESLVRVCTLPCFLPAAFFRPVNRSPSL
jgi:hypothetical protein